VGACDVVGRGNGVRKNTKTAEDNAKRIVKKFLFWPRTIGHECRWLEWAIIEQRYIVGVNHCAWMDERWLTSHEELASL